MPRRAWVAVVLGVVLSLAGPPVAVTAAPAAADPPAATGTSEASRALDAVRPTPRESQARDDGFPVTPVVGLVRGSTVDASAERVVRRTLERAGVDRIVATDGEDPRTPVTIWLGGSPDVLGEFGVKGTGALPAEGYVLATGRTDDDRKHAVLAGADTDGTYYAARTLDQLLTPHAGLDRLPGVEIRDWPRMTYRGSIEGFYGTPWTQAERLDHLDYLGAHRMNTYVYAPKDDPYHREKWRDPYPQADLERLGELVDRARENHVDFTFALSPGLSVCYTSEADRDALIAKFQALYGLGARSFNVPLDDIDYNTWNCPEDKARFGTGGEAAGRAQAYLLNQVRNWVSSKGDIAPLQMVPTEYYNVTESPYKKALRDELADDVVVQWTGTAVIPRTITVSQARAAREVFGHEILVWDNYPVNDYIAGRVPLGDYSGREPGLSGQVAGLVANPANQPAMSKISLFSVARYTWDDIGFEAHASWLAALDEMAGGDPQVTAAMRAFADVSTYDATLHTEQAPELGAAVDEFWETWYRGDRAGALAALRPRITALAEAPATIRAGASDPEFAEEASVWLDATELWAGAVIEALDMLQAQSDGDGTAAWAHRGRIQPLVDRATALRDTRAPHDGTYPRVGDGVLDTFLDEANGAFGRWLGATPSRPTGKTSLGTYGSYTATLMTDGDPATFFWSNKGPAEGDWVGVDLGAVRQIGDVSLLMGKPTSPGDYIGQGTLEYSADGRAWTALTDGTTPEVGATAPDGTQARYVRYRATAGSGNWVVVREFTVGIRDSDGSALTVTGGPAARTGSPLAAAADGDPDTWYGAASAPADGDALLVTAGRARPLDRVLVLAAPDARADVEIRTSDGQWKRLGRLADGGYTDLPADGTTADAVRLAWDDGSPAPRIAEIVPRYADVPAADLALDPRSVDLEPGATATALVRLGSTRAADITGTLSLGDAPGLTATVDHAELTVPRGTELRVAVRLSAAAGAATGPRTVPVTFTPADGTPLTADLDVRIVPATTDTDIARGRPVTASGVEPITSYVSENAVDGSLDTRWASGYDDSSWLTVDLGAPTRIGRAVLYWESAYGTDYRVEVSDDGTTWHTAAEVTAGDGGTDDLRFDATGRYVRLQGVARATTWGYSLWEFEVYPVRTGS